MDAENQRPRIVLADDNFTTQQVLRLSLAGENLEIECCDTGEAALKEVSETPTHVLLCNVYLPDMDGYDLCRRLRQQHLRTRVVMLVGAFQSFDEDKAHQVGCFHSLSKPFDTFSLVNLVKQLIASGLEPEPEVVRAAGLLFEPRLGNIQKALVFDLNLDQSRCRPNHLAREILVDDFPRVANPRQDAPSRVISKAESSAVSEVHLSGIDRAQLLEKLSERVPDAIRELLPKIIRELDESR